MNSPRAFIKILWFGFVASAAILSTGLSLIFVTKEPAELGARLNPLNWGEKHGQETVTMLFTGDLMLGRYIQTLRMRNGGDFPFTYMPEIIFTVEDKLEVAALDLIIGNLEGPITDSDYTNPGTAMIFNFKPEVADLLAKAGFTTMSMANNHAFDQGRQGIDQTYNYLSAAGIRGFGHPDTVNGDYSFTHYEFDQTTVGFLGLDDVDFKPNDEAVLAKIRELDPLVDFLIIGIHWGIEYETLARESIVDDAHNFVDAGADMIWGHHPHVIQNWELYQGKPIYYSLGNFVFDQYWSAATQEGLVVGLRLDNDGDTIKITTTELYVDLVNQGEPKLRAAESSVATE